MLESQVKKTIKNPVVFRTTGIVSISQKSSLQDEFASVDVDQEEDSDMDQEEGSNMDEEEEEPIVELGSVNPEESDRSLTGRLCDKLCFVCKMKVGAIHNQRIGNSIVFYIIIINLYLVCRKKECTRGAAHLACVNFRPSSGSALSFLRSNYCCPRHSKVTNLSVFFKFIGKPSGWLPEVWKIS